MARTRKRRKPAAATPPPGRYTPPQPRSTKESPLWVPATMFAALLTGVAIIVGNYMELLPGGAAQNSYLFVGLGMLITGFVLSTQYR
jgi:hypothetical protein